MIQAPRRLGLEALEQKLPLYSATGYAWADPNVSFSFVPDGTSVEGHGSVLFAELDATAPRDVWQREFARALQTWANSANLNFHKVADEGAPLGSGGGGQGNPGFGDIRLASRPLQNNFLAYAYYPVNYNTLGGDIYLDSGTNFQIGSRYDLYSVLLHESGHALGLGHSSGTIMNSRYSGVLSGLTADDIAGIQSIYGARQIDAFDALASNASLPTASQLSLDDDGTGSWEAELSSMSDLDFYSVDTAASYGGQLSATVNVDQLSLLAPKITVYDAEGNLLAEADADYGSNVTVDWDFLAASHTIYLAVEGATEDEFGMGAYQLDVQFTPYPPAAVPADRLEANDAFAEATDLGVIADHTENDLTLHAMSDVDYFRFQTRQSGTYQVRLVSDFAYALTLYDEQGNLLTSETDGPSTQWLSGTFFLQVDSPAQDLGSYDLAIEQLSKRPIRWWEAALL